MSLRIDSLRLTAPRRSWLGEPLAGTSLVALRELAGEDDLGWAAIALAEGRVRSRSITPSLKKPWQKRPRVHEGDVLHVSASVGSSCYVDRCYGPYAVLNLYEGRLESFECSDCDSWLRGDGRWDDEDDDGREDLSGAVPCRHAAALALALLMDPKSFEGCPEGLESCG